MALGTPVAGAAVYTASGSTQISPAYPAGILSTDVVLLFLGQKPITANGGLATTPTGWTLREELLAAGGYGTTLGVDTGNTNLRIYSWDTPVTGQTGTRAVATGNSGVAWAFIVRIPTSGGAISYGSADGQRTTTPTSPMSIALTNGTSATNFQAGDKAIWAMCIPTDVTTPAQFSAQSITATGATFATAVELNEPDTTLGNDLGGYSAYAHVNSGSSTTAPTVAASITGTLTNVRGSVALLRIREAISLDAQPASFSLTGSNATTTITRSVVASPASYVITGFDATLTYVAAPLWQVSWAEMEIPAGAVSLSLNAETGNFSLTGSAATLSATKVLNSSPASYSLTGSPATLSTAKVLNSSSSSYTVTGVDAVLTYTPVSFSPVLDASNGSYSLSGAAASLVTARNLNLQSGSYSLTGSAATLARTLTLLASPASFVVAGSDCSLLVTRNANLVNGTYTISGAAATIGRQITLNAGFGEYNISLPVQSQTYVLKWYTGTAWQILYKDPIVYP